MEQARLFIAIGISFAIFFLWSMFFAPTPQETPTQLTQDNTQAQNTVKETPAEAAPEAPAPAAARKRSFGRPVNLHGPSPLRRPCSE
jgi:YidC/Oxa1 family membrane protein insertase